MQFSEHDHLHTGIQTDRARFHTMTENKTSGYKIEEFFEPTSPGGKRPTFNSEYSTFEESAPITNMLLGSGGRRGALATMAEIPSEMMNLI